jgi:hypothetical protein
VAEFPLPSVTVTVTELLPISAQVKLLGFTLMLAIPQLSVEADPTCAPVIETFPEASS